MEKYITLNEYELTNINLDGYYIIQLKNDKGYLVYKQDKRYYIKKDNELYYLDDDVRKAYISNVREYERYGI